MCLRIKLIHDKKCTGLIIFKLNARTDKVCMVCIITHKDKKWKEVDTILFQFPSWQQEPRRNSYPMCPIKK